MMTKSTIALIVIKINSFIRYFVIVAGNYMQVKQDTYLGIDETIINIT